MTQADSMTQAEATGLRETYERDGYCFPLRARSPDAAKRYVAALYSGTDRTELRASSKDF